MKTSRMTDTVGTPTKIVSSYAPPQLHDFLNEIEDGYYETDLHGNFIFVNDSLCRMCGYTVTDILSSGSNWYANFTDAENGIRLKNAFAEVYTTDQPVPSIEISILSKESDQRFLEISISLCKTPDHDPIGFRGFVRDVTNRHVLETALATRMNMLALLQQVDRELSCEIEAEVVVRVCMQAAIQISQAEIGFTAMIENGHIYVVQAIGFTGQRELNIHEGVVGRVLRTLQPELIADVRQDRDYIADMTGMEAEITVPLVARDRLVGILNLETQQRAHFSPEVYEFILLLATRMAGALDNAILMRTARDQVLALQELYTQVSALERLKTDMIRIAAHDMRGPLSIINTYNGLLREDLDPHLTPEHAGYFDAIERATDRMVRLSTDVLSLERLQEKQKSTSQLDFTELATVVSEHHLHEAQERAVRMHIHIPKMAIPVVGDETELSEAISNLIANALKYTPTGGQVIIKVDTDNTRMAFEVEDTGYGIPEPEQKKLFEPFYRVQTRDTLKITGTGLGLYLVKQIVERHGGEIFFESRYGVGSRFGFTLPVAVSDAVASISTRETQQVRRVGA